MKYCTPPPPHIPPPLLNQCFEECKRTIERVEDTLGTAHTVFRTAELYGTRHDIHAYAYMYTYISIYMYVVHASMFFMCICISACMAVHIRAFSIQTIWKLSAMLSWMSSVEALVRCSLSVHHHTPYMSSVETLVRCSLSLASLQKKEQSLLCCFARSPSFS